MLRERFLQNPALEICTVEYSDVLVMESPVPNELLNLVDQVERFTLLGRCLQYNDLFPIGILRRQSLFNLANVMLNEVLADFEYLWGASVVAIQDEDLRSREQLLKVDDISDRSRHEAVDALPIVATTQKLDPLPDPSIRVFRISICRGFVSWYSSTRR